jgi:hypothetical protein
MKTLKTTMFVTACMAMMCACTDQSTLDENQGSNESNELVELKINPSIALTRAAVAGTDGKVLENIAVYSTGTENNYAIYNYPENGSSWGVKGSDKIYLSKDAVTIFAYYPAYQADGSTALKINESGTPSTSSTINVSLNGGADSAGDDNKIIVASNEAGSINTTAKDIDYMYAVSGGNGGAQNTVDVALETQPTANSTSSSVSLKMKHAMALVSFKVVKEKYNNTGSLTKIVLNSNNSTTLTKGNSDATMNISTGNITVESTATAAKFTRFIYTGDAAGYTLKEDASQSPAFSILTYPNETADKSSITVEVTIDGQTYSHALPSSSPTSQAWAAGKNHVYTLKLSGKELSITNVAIESWGTDVPMGDVTLE